MPGPDGPFANDFAGDPAVAAHVSMEAEVAAILEFEMALAEAQAEIGVIEPEAAAAIREAGGRLRGAIDLDDLRRGFARDGVVVPALVRQLREAVGATHSPSVHEGATSQDAIDTGLMLRLRGVLSLLDARLGQLSERLGRLSDEAGSQPLMAQTRMQAALTFTLADRLASWRRPLEKHRARLSALQAALPLQLGGPIGNGESFGPDYAGLRRALAAQLGLADAAPWQSDRSVILDIAQAFALVSGTTGKIGQDLALMAQTGIATVVLADGGGSSAMAHKQNPVGAEVLVALGRFNAGLLGTMAQSMIHENERSGAAWTLEWLLLPQMAETTGRALAIADTLLAGARFPLGDPAS